MENDFDEIKGKLCQPPVLIFPDFGKPFVFETDAPEHSRETEMISYINYSLRVVQ